MTTPPAGTSQRQVSRYARIALVAFSCFLVVLVLIIFNVEKLTAHGLFEPFYYIVLCVMGVAFSPMLFGVLRSSGAYKGDVMGGRVELSGPIVGVLLFPICGYHFMPKASTFPLTVYVHGEGGANDIILEKSGQVVLRLGLEDRSADIGENGQSFFPVVPAEFRGQQVKAWVKSDGYESIERTVKLDGSGVDLTVKKKIKHFELAGTVFDADGNPLAGVHVALPEFNAEDNTNENGRFLIRVVADGQQIVSLIAQKQGYQTARLSPTLGDTGLSFSLRRHP